MSDLLALLTVLVLAWLAAGVFNIAARRDVRRTFAERPDIYADRPEWRRELMAAAQFKYALFRVDE